MNQFAHKNVLITGASRGLGLALANNLARAGARVVMVARHADALERAVARITGAGFIAHAIAADLADKHAIHRIAGQAMALVGPIDLLIHNASTLGPVPMPVLLDTECEELEHVLQVNLIGPFRLSKVVVGAMALRGAGTVLHVSSDAALESYPAWGAYGASKAALDHLSRTFAAEVPGVRFLSVDPGEMNTRMHADALPDADPASLADPDEIARRVLAMLLDPARAPSGSRLRAADFSPVATDSWPGQEIPSLASAEVRA